MDFTTLMIWKLMTMIMICKIIKEISNNSNNNREIIIITTIIIKINSNLQLTPIKCSNKSTS